MSDIVTRLLLKTNDFDTNLNKAKGSVNGFQGSISNMAKTAGAGIAKFAGGVGLAIGASEGFMKVIRGSQTTSDEFDARLRVCQTSVSEFFTSLSTGDFTPFLNGLDSIAQKSADANARLDQLGNARISYDYFKESFNADMARGKMEAMDKDQPLDKRKDGLDLWSKGLEDKAKKGSSVKADALSALKSVLAEGNLLNANSITLEDFEAVLAYDVAGDTDRDRIKKAMADKYDTYRVKSKELSSRKVNGGVPDWAFPNSEGAKERRALNDMLSNQQQELNDQFKDAILFNQMLVKFGDEELKNATQLGKEYKQIGRELDVDKFVFNKTKDRISKEGGDKKKDEPLTGSLAYFDAEIAKKNKELINATTAQARTAVQVAIGELEAKRINLKIELDKSVFKELHGEMNGGDIKTNGITGGHGISKETIKDMKLPKFKSPISKKDVKLNEEYNDSLTAMGGLMGSLSGAFESNTGSVLQWGATLLSTIAQAIPAIIGMMGVKATDTTVTQANTAAEAGNAAAKTMSAHASIPFAGIAIGLAGVASIIAVMSSMPKFATGGIVGGSSFAGDNVLARVNSGEMILNAGQQSNLFRLLNGQVSAQRPVLGSISNIRMQSEKQIVEVDGHVRIQGSDLILAINNKNSKMKGKR